MAGRKYSASGHAMRNDDDPHFAEHLVSSSPRNCYCYPFILAKPLRRGCDSTDTLEIEIRPPLPPIARAAPESIAADPKTRLRPWPTPATLRRSQPPTIPSGSRHS